MTTRIQRALIWTAASLAAAGWFALWLTAFEPTPQKPAARPHRAPLHLSTAPRQSDSSLLHPTLFALPSEQGFSRGFPEKEVHFRLELERPVQPAIFLDRAPKPVAPIVRSTLMNPARLPQNALPAPGAPPRSTVPPLQQHHLHPSPDLPELADPGGLPELDTEGLPAALSLVLFLRTDGTVERVLLDTPVDRPSALLRALRSVRFAPPGRPVQGRAELRLSAEGGAS